VSNSYIELRTSDLTAEEDGYYFRVLWEGGDGYHAVYKKTTNMQPTVTGKTDFQVGHVRRVWRYLLKVYETDPSGGNYGTISDLETLFALNDPTASPSNVLTLVDHYEDSYEVYLVGQLDMTPITPRIEGTAWFRAPIMLLRTTAES